METNPHEETEAPAAASNTPADHPAPDPAAPSAVEPSPVDADTATDTAPPKEPQDAQELQADTATEPDAPADETSTPGDPLAALADQALRGRLSPADEERATTLLKAALVDGRTGMTLAIEQLPKLPWVIGVNAVSATWTEIKPTLRTRLVAGLARIDTDAARRVRLSLARGIFKQDVPASLKIAVSVAKEIRDKQTGAISPRNAQIFANVLIGRAKPWIGLLPLADLKPAEADLLVHCALLAVFSLPHAPVTQLGALRWAAENGRLGKLHPLALEAVVKTVGRWSGKWQGALRREVPELPEEIASVLNAPAAPVDSRRQPKSDARAESTPDGKLEEREEQPQAEGRGRSRRGERSEREEDEHEARTEEQEDAEGGSSAESVDEEDTPDHDAEAPETRAPKPRPVYESKTVPAQMKRGGAASPGHFNLPETLRQIEAHVASLRSELQTAQAKLRQREDDPRRSRRPDRAAGPILRGDPSVEELARLNQQLEARNAELQSRIEELTVDSEDRAAASLAAASGDATAPPPEAQLRVLLGFKLQDDFADFLALEKEAPDIVVQQHYRTVLRHVFEVLKQEGVALTETAE